MKATKKQPSIKKLNEAYEKATPAERRRMIARDALAQIKAETFTAVSGQWIDVVVDGKEVGGDAPLQQCLLTPGVSCQCCGAGAIFLSYVRLNNHANYDDGWSFNDILNATNWPYHNLRLIEIAFELGEGNCKVYEDNPDYEQSNKARCFGEAFEDETDRLTAILENIASNKEGLFTP